MKRSLLFSITKKDLKVEYFSGTGKGGQYRNKHQNCVRLHHPDSGVIVTGQSHRERKGNLREARLNLIKHPKFRMWHIAKSWEVLEGQSLEEKVEKMMRPENLRIEAKEGGRWVEMQPN
jgi:protein subunit release factor A